MCGVSGLVPVVELLFGRELPEVSDEEPSVFASDISPPLPLSEVAGADWPCDTSSVLLVCSLGCPQAERDKTRQKDKNNDRIFFIIISPLVNPISL